MYTCIVVDDEQQSIDGIKSYIAAVPELTLVATYADPLVALRELKSMPTVDVLFLDVDMPKITGIELAGAIRDKAKKLVYITAHAKYAYDAFRTDADDYLLKPYSLGQFLICFEKLFPASKGKAKPNRDDFFFIRSREDTPKLVKIAFADIVMVESKRNYILIYTPKKQILTYMSLTEIAKILLERGDFIQLQRGFIVSKGAIESINGNCVSLVNGIELTVGNNYRQGFVEFVAQKSLRAAR